MGPRSCSTTWGTPGAYKGTPAASSSVSFEREVPSMNLDDYTLPELGRHTIVAWNVSCGRSGGVARLPRRQRHVLG